MNESSNGSSDLTLDCLDLRQFSPLRSEFIRFVDHSNASLSHDPRWLDVLAKGLRHVPFQVRAVRGAEIVGVLPLALLRSAFFGRFLVSLPYVNGGGVLAADPLVANRLIERAIELANTLDVRFLELRHERAHNHPQLTEARTDKAHMRLALPATTDELWTKLKPKVRNQVRKGEGQGFVVQWGREELLADFYRVFSHNMRDLGTPVYGRSLFAEILAAFGDQAELCILRLDAGPVAAALLLHGKTVTDVPSASSLRKYNGTNANMFMYWRLLCRAIDRGQRIFDFGRSTPDSGTYRFKEQWGARPEPSVWQYHVRHGSANQMRPGNGKYGRLVRIWQRLPVPLTRLIGPSIIRGIP